MTTQTEKILQGCGKKVLTLDGRIKIACGGIDFYLFIDNTNSIKNPNYGNIWLCPTCKAQAQTLLEAKKEEVEFLENSETTKEFSYCEDIKERISSLKSDINKLEGIK